MHSGDFTALEKRYLEKLVVTDSNVGHWMPEVSAAPRKGWQCSSCLAMTETAHYCYRCYYDFCPKCGVRMREGDSHVGKESDSPEMPAE